MTLNEFSDSFDTMLNSYASQAVFGDQAAHTEIVLDEYEKSVLLTQAQDNVIKSYFEKHTNSLGQGFDDSSRRQVDFSSLIKVANLAPSDSANRFDTRGIIYKLPVSMAEDGNEYSRVLYILNEALIGYTGSNKANFIIGDGSTANTRMTIGITNTTNKILQVVFVSDPALDDSCVSDFTEAAGSNYDKLTVVVGNGTSYNKVVTSIQAELANTDFENITVEGGGQAAVKNLSQLSSTLLPVDFTQNVRNETRYVIIPINYKEYDREMSKAYGNPLKKQAWRLFQNISTGYDIYSELIPIWNVDTTNLQYKIRYVERPTPIVLTDLPNNLTIDGFSHAQGCILNPIIHPDILKEAVRLAIESRASAVARAEAYNKQDSRRD